MSKVQPGFASARAVPNPAKDVPEPIRWTFSFRFFRQIEGFGLNRTEGAWYISLLEKLTLLGAEAVDDFMSDGPKREAWRFHRVNWDQYNIPIKRTNLNWLPLDVLRNAEEFPIYQFQISLALGRVAGFFDERQVFQIILLDPWHNLQPSRSHNYRVDPCSPLSCEYTRLRENVIVAAQLAACTNDGCGVKIALDQLDIKPPNAFSVIILKPEDAVISDAFTLVESGQADSYEDIFVSGVICHMIRNEPATTLDNEIIS